MPWNTICWSYVHISTYSSRPSYCSLGSRDRFFIKHNDGTMDWGKLPKSLNSLLRKSASSAQQPQPTSVSFGSSFDTWFVVFSDGSWQYQGRGIPESLEEKLNQRDGRADLELVNLGPGWVFFFRIDYVSKRLISVCIWPRTFIVAVNGFWKQRMVVCGGVVLVMIWIRLLPIFWIPTTTSTS